MSDASRGDPAGCWPSRPSLEQAAGTTTDLSFPMLTQSVPMGLTFGVTDHGFEDLGRCG